MNQVAIPTPSTALADRLRTTVAPQTPGDQAGKVYLRFDFQTGKWTCGKEQHDVTDVEALINTASIGHGWTMWVAGTPKKVMAPFDQPIPQAMPPEGQVFPQEARVLSGAFIDEDGGEFIYETNSLGGRNGVDAIIKQVIIRAQQGQETFLYPVVLLTSSSYTHKTHGRIIHTPVFSVVDWADINGVREGQAMLSVDDSDESAEDLGQAQDEALSRRRRRTA
jgi:hypothetical protein